MTEYQRKQDSLGTSAKVTDATVVNPFVLVRHAESHVTPALPSKQWELTAAGCEAAEAMALAIQRFFPIEIVTSEEMKARQTGEILARNLGIEIRTDSRLNEVQRPWTSGDFRGDVLSYLGGDALEEWEPIDDVRSRMASALTSLPRGHIAFVSHGTAMTVFLASMGLVEAASFWSDLLFPDAWLISESTAERIALS